MMTFMKCDGSRTGEESRRLLTRVCAALTLSALVSLPAVAQSGQTDVVASQSERIVSLVSQAALGAVVGYLVAVLLRKAGKILAFAVVAAFALMQVLASYELIDLGPVTAVFDQAMGSMEDEVPSVMDLISANVPAVIGGVLGFLVGIRGGRRKRSDDAK